MKYFLILVSLALLQSPCSAFERDKLKQVYLSKSRFKSMTDLDGLNGRVEYFWLCFNPNQAKFKVICEDWGVHELDGPKGVLDMSLLQTGVKHIFLPRHAELRRYCRCRARRIHDLSRSLAEMCILAETNGVTAAERQARELNWQFIAYKDHLGRLRFEDELCD